MSDFFERKSPYLALMCFGTPLLVTCFIKDWRWALVSLAIAMIINVLLMGIHKLIATLKGMAGLVALLVIINPLVSSGGTREILFVNGRPITIEAVIQGVSLGVMLVAVIVWSSCWNFVMTEEKLSYILRRFSPQVAVVLSMTLRLIPLYKRRWDNMVESHRALGLPEKAGMFSKIKQAVICFSGLMDWGMENGRVTAISMVARGACLDRGKEDI